MEGASTLPIPIPGSPSRSAGRKLPRRSAPKYSSCLLYNMQAAKEKLTGLSVAKCNPSVEEDSPSVCAVEEPLKVSVENEKREYLVSEKMSCNFCQTEFAGRVEQKEHYKSDWHRFNLKQRIKGEFPVSEEAFEVLSGNISSLSGSDTDTDASDTETESVPRNKPLGLPARVRHSIPSGSDSDSESVYTERLSARKYPKVYMRNNNGELISLYRCVLHHKKCRPESHSALTSVASELPNHMTWAVLMAGGGHFAGAIFENGVIAQHKTFHRYVVRAKRGSAQGSRDSQGSAPKSGGASLRRYNEAALMQEIQELLTSWEDMLKKCDLIFLRAPSFNRQIFFGGTNPPLRKNDSRIRVIPFPTRRATYNEVRRVHEMLASIECYGEEEDIREFVPMSPRRHLSTDSGQLEPLAASPKKKPSKSKTSLSPLSKSSSEENQTSSAPEKSPSYPVLESLRERRQSQSSLGSSASDIDLVELQEEISTLDLKLFEATKKPRRRNPKKKRNMSPSHHQIEPESNILEEEKYHLKNTLYTACKTGDTDSLRNLLAIFSNPICKTSPTMAKPPADTRDGLRENDKEHRTESAMLASETVQHQASVNKEGLDKPAPVAELPSPVVTSEVLNEPIGDGKMTLLHVAAKEGHPLIIGLLLGAGADPSLRDRFGQTSYSCGKSKETRNEFRRFMAKFPDRYDYQKAEIPGPLTEDMEKERKQKEVERKKAQKKARQERLKDKREEDDKQRKEDAEKRRFLGLSDREKRALAAERRLLQSAESSGQSAPVLVRCWCCGADMTGKVPFEYSDYKFCSPKCLKQHRLDNSKKKSGS